MLITITECDATKNKSKTKLVLSTNRIISIREGREKGDIVEIRYNYNITSKDACPSVYFIDSEQWKTLRAIMISRGVLINI